MHGRSAARQRAQQVLTVLKFTFHLGFIPALPGNYRAGKYRSIGAYTS